MSSHEKSHGNDLHGHFPSVNDEEYEIDYIDIIGNKIDFFVESKEEAVDENDEEDKSIEPGVNVNYLNDFVSKWISDRKATQ